MQLEMNQLQKRKVFEPINPSDLTYEERKKAMESLIFLTEKKIGILKACNCANGIIQRNYITKDDASSPIVSTDSVLITSAIRVRQKKENPPLTANVPNAFVQIEIPKTTKGERVIMKIKGILAKMLCEIAPNTYLPFVTYENNQHTI